MPELSYRQAVQTFGEAATAELIYLVGLYCLVSVTLNGFDVPVPEAARVDRRDPDQPGSLDRDRDRPCSRP